MAARTTSFTVPPRARLIVLTSDSDARAQVYRRCRPMCPLSEDPVARLAAVQAELQTLKTAKEAMVGEALTSLGRYTPFPFASWWVRLAFGLPQRDIVTVTTNVPGPRQPLYGMGRQILEIIPYVPIATTLRTGISIFTYCDHVTFGITGDFAANPDVDVLAHGIEQGVSELLKAAAGQ